jgi:HEAT repeat protein
MRSPLFLLVTLVLLQVPLAGCGDDVDRYLADLGSRNPMVRLEAAKLARRVDEPRLAAALAPLLTDGSQDIRYNAAVSLAYIGTTEQVPVLIHALGDEDREVRLAVVDALGQLEDERAVPSLLAMLDTEPEPYSVIWALGNIGNDGSLDALTPMLDDDNRYVRYQSRRALLKIR